LCIVSQTAAVCCATYRQWHSVLYHSHSSTLCCATHKQRHSVLYHSHGSTLCCVTYKRPHASDLYEAKVGRVQKLLSFCRGIQIECHATASQPSKVGIWNDSVQRKLCLQHSFSLLPWWIECFFSVVSPLISCFDCFYFTFFPSNKNKSLFTSVTPKYCNLKC
jgi:hypothetical protein